MSILPYVSVEKLNDEPCLCVDYRKVKQWYPLTADGCREAGRELHARGWLMWQYSSSADFPREYKPTFLGDVREYIETEYARIQRGDNANKTG